MRIVALTGAGMSAESGVPTFRDAQTGLWARFDPQALATPEAFAADPARVWGWYRDRAAGVAAARPHAGHAGLARIARTHGLRVITQNVDDLHERAGSPEVVHLHGALFASRCSRCARPATPEPLRLPASPDAEGRVPPPACAYCGALVRPGVVWFGEALPAAAWEAALAAVREAELVLAIGSSGLVHPAASLPAIAAAAGAAVLEINPSPTPLTALASASWRCRAAEGVQRLAARLDAGERDPAALLAP
ncbi:SIR2 family NAD-dependent protein deacylase [Luteimonas huabeiensis]|uniref:SIR2 family NAD-dependent protein deacylase n=1 Tax=Luteimonas huabeiensis TaxID=1244513 RepID=UPI00046353ED|nr:NAD-dependent protein deacylase [Luteimonas huabeiensis]